MDEMEPIGNHYLVDKDASGEPFATLSDSVTLDQPEAGTGDTLVEVEYSSLNYKDALAATGHPGVALNLPLVPGIDAVGRVLSSGDDRLSQGQQVIIAHAEFGTSRWGGWRHLARVPADWCVSLPEKMSGRTAMCLGTAGFTAAQSLDKLQLLGISPDTGPVLVTGATGGVGILAVKLLSRQGYQVIASTGKMERAQQLKELGASEVIDRREVQDNSNKPLLKGRWSAAVDSVGGNTLASIIRSAKPGAVVAACGLVGGVKLSLTVYPFILRGVVLHGIDTAGVSRQYREQIWRRLGNQWSLGNLDAIIEETQLADIQSHINKILEGQVVGRVVVRIE